MKAKWQKSWANLADSGGRGAGVTSLAGPSALRVLGSAEHEVGNSSWAGEWAGFSWASSQQSGLGTQGRSSRHIPKLSWEGLGLIGLVACVSSPDYCTGKKEDPSFDLYFSALTENKPFLKYVFIKAPPAWTVVSAVFRGGAIGWNWLCPAQGSPQSLLRGHTAAHPLPTPFHQHPVHLGLTGLWDGTRHSQSCLSWQVFAKTMFSVGFQQTQRLQHWKGMD